MRNLLLSTVTLVAVPVASFASSNFFADNLTTPIELKSISQLNKAYKTAGVCFLTDSDCHPVGGFSFSSNTDGTNENFDLDTIEQCLNEGFSKLNCNSVQEAEGVCPYNSAYGRGCKCASNLIECPAGQVGEGDSCDGKYASCKCDPNLKTCSSKEVGQGASCGGKYESCVCKPEYQYDANNCSYPQSTSGDSCQGKYTNCICPTGVDEGPYGCEEYYPAPCDYVCKIANEDACAKRPDNNSAVYGCMKYWDDCDTKCETPYKDNCRNRTAVVSSCPPNATCDYYSDCSSKISTWYCNPGITYYSDDGCALCSELKPVTIPEGASCVWNEYDCNGECREWMCGDDYQQDGDRCIYCKSVDIPENAECSFYNPDCSGNICAEWQCKDGYAQEGNSCVEDEIVSFRATMSSSNCYIKYGDSFCDASGTCCCVYSSGISSCHSLSIREVDEDFGIESEFNYNCGLDCGVQNI